MSGWYIRVDLNRTVVETLDSKRPEPLFSWESFNAGTAWLDSLVAQGKASITLQGSYPRIYTSTVQHILPLIGNGPPTDNRVPGPSAGVAQQEPWPEQFKPNVGLLRRGSPSQILSIEAWDIT